MQFVDFSSTFVEIAIAHFDEDILSGTILIDLETHHPVNLHLDYTVDIAKKWLLEHPGMEIITRARAPIYHFYRSN